jgi:hypothetical protein
MDSFHSSTVGEVVFGVVGISGPTSGITGELGCCPLIDANKMTNEFDIILNEGR